MANLNKIIRYWKTKNLAMKTKRDATYQLQKLHNSLPATEQAQLMHIRKAICAYDKELPNAKKHRQEQIYEWAEAAAKRGDKTTAHHFRSMAFAEDSKKTFRILQHVIKPQDRSGLKKLDVPATNNDGQLLFDSQGNTLMETICDPTNVEELQINRNKQHFGQAQGTPFTEQKLIDIFGIDGDAQATDDLIQGVLPDNTGDLPPTVQTILRKIAETPQKEFINTEVDTDQLTNMFKHWKERTSTSLSGCHLGHWHALLAPDGMVYPKEGTIKDVGPQ